MVYLNKYYTYKKKKKNVFYIPGGRYNNKILYGWKNISFFNKIYNIYKIICL